MNTEDKEQAAQSEKKTFLSRPEKLTKEGIKDFAQKFRKALMAHVEEVKKKKAEDEAGQSED